MKSKPAFDTFLRVTHISFPFFYIRQSLFTTICHCSCDQFIQPILTSQTEKIPANVMEKKSQCEAEPSAEQKPVILSHNWSKVPLISARATSACCRMSALIMLKLYVKWQRGRTWKCGIRCKISTFWRGLGCAFLYLAVFSQLSNI